MYADLVPAIVEEGTVTDVIGHALAPAGVRVDASTSPRPCRLGFPGRARGEPGFRDDLDRDRVPCDKSPRPRHECRWSRVSNRGDEIPAPTDRARVKALRNAA